VTRGSLSATINAVCSRLNPRSRRSRALANATDGKLADSRLAIKLAIAAPKAGRSLLARSGAALTRSQLAAERYDQFLNQALGPGTLVVLL
jgi:hypothetical protein